MKILYCSLVIVLLGFSGSFSQAAETIKVASIFAKTGVAAGGNKSAIDGVRFAVDELNFQGGLLGKKVEIIEIDNHSTALYSKKAAEEAVAQGVIAVFGANWSSHSLAMAPVLQAAHIPMISTFSTNPEVTQVGDFIFRVCFVDSFQGRIMARFAMSDLHARKAAILINTSSRYSEGLAGFFRNYFVGQGGEIVLEEGYLQDMEDFSSYLERIVALTPDILFVPGNILDSARIIRQFREAGLSIPILGGDGWGDSMYAHAGSTIDGNFFSGHWHEDNENAKSLDFVKKFRQQTGVGGDMGAALAYDAVFVFADAVQRAESLVTVNIRDALAATEKFNGVTGTISFDEIGDPIKSGVISKFERGKIVYVKTIEP